LSNRKVQKMLNSLQTADPFETWHKNRSSLKVVLCFWNFQNGRQYKNTKFHEVWWKESKFFLNPPFFVSMATAAKFVHRFRFVWLISFH
jgi:hypothetical protein